MNLAYSAVQIIRRQSNEQSARRSRAEHIRSSSRSFRDERRPRRAFQASDENIHRGRKRRTPIDGARTVVPSQARSRTRLQKLSVLIIEGRVVLRLQGFPLLLQGTPPRYSRFCGADCFGPGGWLFRLRRLPLLSDRRHQRQHLCRHCRAALDRLHSHWADGRWFAFRHARVTVSGDITVHILRSISALDLERCFEPDVHRRLRFSALVQPGQIPAFSQSCPDHHRQVCLRPRAVTIRSWRRVHQRSHWRHCLSREGALAPACLFQH
jgi:hypothetical protein